MSSIEWLQEKIFNIDWKNMNGEDKLKLFEQAKEMHKQEIIKTGLDCGTFVDLEDVEYYYNITFKKD